jgi:hypothetical protein
MTIVQVRVPGTIEPGKTVAIKHYAIPYENQVREIAFRFATGRRERDYSELMNCTSIIVVEELSQEKPILLAEFKVPNKLKGLQ